MADKRQAEVYLNDEDLGIITGVSINISAPQGARGEHAGFTRAAAVTVKRRAHEVAGAKIEPWALATNETGTLCPVTLRIEILDPQGLDNLYTIESDKAFISRWYFEEFVSLYQKLAIEVIELQCGQMSFAAGEGGNANFALENFSVRDE